MMLLKKTFFDGWKALQSDEVLKQKYAYTFGLYCCAFVFGWIKGQIGPSLPDLRLVAGIDIGDTSWIFTTYYAAFVIGGVISFLIYSRMNRKLLLSVNNLLLCVTMAAIPWCPNLLLMLLAFFGTGLAEGIIDPTMNARIIMLWSSEGKHYVYLMNTILSLATILSPLVTGPFLLQLDSTDKNSSLLEQDNKGESQSKIYIAFCITASLALSTSLYMIVLYIRSKTTRKGTAKDGISSEMYCRPLPTCPKAIVFIIIGLFMFLSSGIEEIFVGYLSSFCITYMGWRKRDGAHLTSLMYLLFVIGRISSIFISKCLSTHIHIGIHCVTITAAFTGFLVSAIYQFDLGIWLFVPLYGLGTSAVMPLLLCWCNENFMPVSGQIASYAFLTAFSGSALNPFLVRLVLSSTHSIWFCYLFLFESIVLLAVYIFGYFFTKRVVEIYGKPFITWKEYEMINTEP